MTSERRTGILGGTFDPIHLGHLDAAEIARLALDLDEILVIPAHAPPHRPESPWASGHHRFAMAALAVLSRVACRVSDVELRTPGPSYSSNTLERLHRAGYRAEQLFFIIGADAFAEIATWQDYPAILDLCHFAVVSRPGHPVRALRQLAFLAPKMRDVPASEEMAPVDRLPEWTMSGAPAKLSVPASELAIFLIDAPTPDVSSTKIRQRLADGGSITHMVPVEVERHIERHGLYARGSAAREAACTKGAEAGDLHEQNRR